MMEYRAEQLGYKLTNKERHWTYIGRGTQTGTGPTLKEAPKQALELQPERGTVTTARKALEQAPNGTEASTKRNQERHRKMVLSCIEEEARFRPRAYSLGPNTELGLHTGFGGLTRGHRACNLRL